VLKLKRPFFYFEEKPIAARRNQMPVGQISRQGIQSPKLMPNSEI
jgi:hypothetical protein